jgi:chaperonin GroES
MNANVIALVWFFFGIPAVIVAIWIIEKFLDYRSSVIRRNMELARQQLFPRINYTPRGDRVIVKRAERKPQEAGGIALPDSQQRPLNSGTVIAVGPGARNSVTGEVDAIEDLEPGDTVEFLDYAGAEIEVDGETYLCLRILRSAIPDV